jgi:cobalt/nickel transport system permease protein
MHIPDGFLDAKTVVTTAAVSVVGLGFALRQVRQSLPPRRVPLLGLSAAFLFAAQMVNFPVAGGTSGHLIGGALVAALLGPSAAVVVVATVLIVQCFLFADGGVLALGANLFNMGLVATLSGYAIYQLVQRLLPGPRGRVAAMMFAGWCSTVLAAISCAGQLAWSGTIAWSVALPAMTGVHMLIGLGEGSISALVLVAIARTRPDLLAAPADHIPLVRLREFVVLGLLVSLGVALFVAPFACPWPDGLEAVASRLGFAGKASAPLLSAPAAQYQISGLGSPGWATAAAGIVGTLVVFSLAILFSRLVVRETAAPKSSGG